MIVVQAIVAVFTILSIGFFLVYIVGLIHTPTGHRPKSATYNRFGEVIGETENPGYEETIDEQVQ